MKKKIVCVILTIMVSTTLSACNIGDALIAAGESLKEDEATEEESEEIEDESEAISEEAVEESDTEIDSEEGYDDDVTGNPPAGDVYDYGDGMSAEDYLETNYSSYQNGGVLDFGAKQGNVGVAFDESINFFFEATQNKQSFAMEMEYESEGLMENAIVADVNFDGYNDFLLPYSLGASNISYTAFIYENWSGYFVENDEMREVYNPGFNSDKRIVTSFSHISAGEYEECIYEWLDNYSLYCHFIRNVTYNDAQGVYDVKEIYLSTDGRIGEEKKNQYTEEQLISLPSMDEIEL